MDAQLIDSWLNHPVTHRLQKEIAVQARTMAYECLQNADSSDPVKSLASQQYQRGVVDGMEHAFRFVNDLHESAVKAEKGSAQ